MFNTQEEAYQFIGKSLYINAPKNFKSAWIEITVFTVDHVVEELAGYSDGIKNHYLDLEMNIEGEEEDPDTRFAFYKIYHLMQKDENDVPWNKAKFTLTSEGKFDLEFKLDEDFEWFKNLNKDSSEYDSLDIKLERKVARWEGLTEEESAQFRPRH